MSIFHPIDTINAIVPYIGILGKNTLEDLNFVKKD